MENKAIENLLVAQVATLALQLKQAKANKGMSTTDNCIGEAVRLIQQQRDQILRMLSETR